MGIYSNAIKRFVRLPLTKRHAHTQPWITLIACIVYIFIVNHIHHIISNFMFLNEGNEWKKNCRIAIIVLHCENI